MKTKTEWRATCATGGLLAVLCLNCGSVAGGDLEEGRYWRGRFDIGGSIPQSARLTEFAGPVTGQEMKLSPGFQFDMSFGYRVTPWLEVGPELGFTFNSVDSFGNFSYPNTTLFQMPIMANLTLEYPYAGRLVPYVGGGIGGVASFLTFGSHWEWEPDGSGSDFVLGFQAFAGLRYRLSDRASIGVQYRFLASDEQNWDVEWWTGTHFNVAVDSIRLHSFSLVFTSTF